MGKRLLLIGYNFLPEPTGIGKYSGEMITWLANRGYDCTVLTTYPYYPYWKVQEPYFKNRFWYLKETKKFDSGGKMTVYRCPMYVPNQPSGLKRMLLDFSFMGTALLKLFTLMFHKKYDAVITVVPSFQFGLLGCFYKSLRKTKLVYHIQDMQIEAAQDLKMITSQRMVNTLFKVERYIFKKTDIISSISEKMVSKIREKAKKDVILFPNWTDTEFFRPVSDKRAIKEVFGFKGSDKIILYSGAIGEKQGLEAILYAAEPFKNDMTVKFLICGSGPYKEKLQTLAKTLQLDNVIFFPLQPMDKFNQFLNIADVHLVIQKAKASDLVMPSKLTTILSVGGIALITANPDSGLYSLVDKYHMGILINAEDQDALTKGIQAALTSKDNITIKENARNYAENYLEINNVMKSFETTVLNIY